MNIVFDRVGKDDPVTKGMEIAVHWMGFDIDVSGGVVGSQLAIVEYCRARMLRNYGDAGYGTFWQVRFWSQHISFLLVGVIVVTSIRFVLLVFGSCDSFPRSTSNSTQRN